MYIADVNNILFLVNTMKPTLDHVANEVIMRAAVVNGDVHYPIKLRKEYEDSKIVFRKGTYRVKMYSLTLEVMKNIYKRARMAEESYIEAAILYANWHICPWINVESSDAMFYFIINDDDFEQEEE